MEADLRRYYHVRLTDLWRGELTLRELRVLVEHLPGDCATARVSAGLARDNPLAHWTLTDVLMARLVDEVSAQRWQWESAHTKTGRAARRPPQSVLPELPSPEPSTPAGADNVIPLMSPHQLGAFVNDQEGD